MGAGGPMAPPAATNGPPQPPMGGMPQPPTSRPSTFNQRYPTAPIPPMPGPNPSQQAPSAAPHPGQPPMPTPNQVNRRVQKKYILHVFIINMFIYSDYLFFQFPPTPVNNLSSRLGGLSLGGQASDCLDLLQNRHILPAKPMKPPKPRLQAELWNDYNCSPDIFRSTLTKVRRYYVYH